MKYRRKAFSHVDPARGFSLAGGKPGSACLQPKEFRRDGEAPAFGGSHPLGCLVFAGLGTD